MIDTWTNLINKLLSWLHCQYHSFKLEFRYVAETKLVSRSKAWILGFFERIPAAIPLSPHPKCRTGVGLRSNWRLLVGFTVRIWGRGSVVFLTISRANGAFRGQDRIMPRGRMRCSRSTRRNNTLRAKIWVRW